MLIVMALDDPFLLSWPASFRALSYVGYMELTFEFLNTIVNTLIVSQFYLRGLQHVASLS